MTRTGLLYLVLAVVAALAAAYCFSGYAMTGSFAEASGDPGAYHGRALMWAGGVLVALVACVGFSGMAWRHRRKG